MTLPMKSFSKETVQLMVEFLYTGETKKMFRHKTEMVVLFARFDGRFSPESRRNLLSVFFFFFFFFFSVFQQENLCDVACLFKILLALMMVGTPPPPPTHTHMPSHEDIAPSIIVVWKRTVGKTVFLTSMLVNAVFGSSHEQAV